MQSLNLLFGTKNFHRPLLFHGGLWIISYTILLFVFSKGESPLGIDYIYSLAFLLVLSAPTLINFYFLIPHYLKKEKYISYTLTFFVVLAAFAGSCAMYFQQVLDYLFPNYFFVSYVKPSKIVLIFIIFTVAATLLKLAEDWFYFNTAQNKLLRYQNELIENQLSSLKAQINPHFLFNSLNVIYALALDQREEIKPAIVQLSDILRYVIYDTNTKEVSLKDEITLINNYIAFQGHRSNLKDKVNFNLDIKNEAFKIYPMLLLPLVENSFKYGLSGPEDSQHITINLTQTASVFSFEISNANYYQKNDIDEAYSGVGLLNLKNNLNLVYPKTHELKIDDSNNTFKVTLKLFNSNA
ncbi:MAG: sensor histidine kinase [Winogradskyella sp.]|nr:sensor histidine kinase [Winogradskyella sp.]